MYTYKHIFKLTLRLKYREKHKDQLEDRMGKGIEKETKQHRTTLDDERRSKV